VTQLPAPQLPAPLQKIVTAAVDTAHYATRGERNADLIVHIVGLCLALFGCGMALGLAVSNGLLGQVAAVTIYSVGLIAMLAFSLAYNMSSERFRPLLRRFDHAGIFLMIAASYTPFTTQALKGGWAIGMSLAIWTLAGLGIAGKLLLPHKSFQPNWFKGLWLALYLALGWLVLIAFRPLIEALPLSALILLAAGGLVYSVGTIFYARKNLKFRRAIWHGHVIAGAGVHYAAILVGIILVAGK
jgi:hemolysin III